MRQKPTTESHRTCEQCGVAFEPKRSTARFCGAACRVSAHRRIPARANRKLCGAFVSVTGMAATQPPSATASVTLRTPIARRSKPLPFNIVPDAKYAGMYRIRLPDGRLTDMVNLTRAKDAASALLATKRAPANVASAITGCKSDEK